MVLLVFTAINPQGEYREQSYGDHDVESCFDQLSELVNRGWHLVSINYFDMDSAMAIELPTAAFDGTPMKEGIRQLQSEWELIIAKA